MAAREVNCILKSRNVHLPLGILDFGFDAEPKPFSLLARKDEHFEYHLGNGVRVRDPDEAAEFYARREFPEIMTEEENDPVFIPESFPSDLPGVLDYNAKSEDDRERGESLEHELYRQAKKYIQEKDTAIFFSWENKWYNYTSQYDEANEKLTSKDTARKETRKSSKTLPSSTGAKGKEARQKTKKTTEAPKSQPRCEQIECDLLIINQKLKTIINIECKHSASRSTKGSEGACKGPRSTDTIQQQLHEHFEYFNKHLSFDKGWRFVKVAAFGLLGGLKINDFCVDCRKFIVLMENQDITFSFSHVWENLKETLTTSTKGKRQQGTGKTPKINSERGKNLDRVLRKEFREHIKRLLFLWHVNVQLCKSSKKVRNPEAAGEKEKKKVIITKKEANEQLHTNINARCIFWTKHQAHILNRDKSKKVAFYSSYGTGKTILLLAKAKDVAQTQPGKKVFFVICSRSRRCLLKMEAQEYFKNDGNVTVRTLHDIVKQDKTKEEWTVSHILKEFVKSHEEEASGFFIDEMPHVHACYRSENDNQNNPQIAPVASLLQSVNLKPFGDLMKNYFLYENQKPESLNRGASAILGSYEHGEIKLLLHPITSAMIKKKKEEEEECFLWFALKSKLVAKTSSLLGGTVEDFTVPELRHNVRSTQNIVQESGLLYTDVKNPVEGRPLRTISVLLEPDNLTENTERLFKAFEEAVTGDSFDDLDDLLVIWQSHDSVFSCSGLSTEIQRYCSQKQVPVFVPAEHDADDADEPCTESILQKPRKGLVLGALDAVMSCDFKSVIAFFNVDQSGKRDVTDGPYSSLDDTIHRAICNLVVVEYLVEEKRSLDHESSKPYLDYELD